jgi:hypothetical protein
VDTVEMHEPYTYPSGLTIKDSEDLIEDIEVRISHNVVLAVQLKVSYIQLHAVPWK